MVLQRTPHAVYDILSHLVWSGLQQRVQEFLATIAVQYDIMIEKMEVSSDHVHIFCSFLPRALIVQVVIRCKSLGARTISREFRPQGALDGMTPMAFAIQHSPLLKELRECLSP
jgi:putative transposase